MQLSLNDIFAKLTPQNLNNIPLIALCRQIFIQNIDSNAKVAKRITEIFNIEPDSGDTAGEKRAKHNLRMALYNTYIYVLWKYTQSVANDVSLREELERYGYTKSALYNDVETIINSEFIQSWHEFTQRVGNNSATRYLYAFARYLETGTIETDLLVDEVNPFIFHYEGALGRSIYNQFMKDMVHPAGWLDFYETVFQTILQDYCGVQIENAYTQIELNCGEYFVVFSDSADKQQVINQFIGRLNPVTMQPYTEDDIAKYVSVIPGKIVSTFRRFINDKNHIINVFVFSDQTVLQHDETTPRHTWYSTYSDYLSGFRDPLLEWDDCWSLKYEQQTNFRFLYTDYHEVFKDFFISGIKEESGGLQAYSCFNSVDPLGMFRVCGRAIQHVPGIDEAFNNIQCSDTAINNANDRFMADFDYFLVTTSDIGIVDSYGNEIKWHYIPKGKHNTKLSTHSLAGNTYTAYIDDYVYPRYEIWASGLNNFKRRCQIRGLSLNHGIAIWKGVILDAEYKYKPKNLKWEMLQRKPFKNLEYYLEFIWEVDGAYDTKYYDIGSADSYNFTFKLGTDQSQRRGTLHIKLYRSATNRLIQHEYYGCSNLQLFDNLRPNISCLKYTSMWDNWNDQIDNWIPSKSVKDIAKPSEMAWYDDYPPEAPARIAERPDGTFYKPYQLRKDLIQYGDDLVGKVVDGSLVQGVPYKDSFWQSWKDDLVFINLGFLKDCYLTSDVYLTDSPQFCTDGDYSHTDSTGGLVIDSIVNKAGYFLYSTGDDPKYLYTFDDYYLYTTTADQHVAQVTVFFNLDGGYGKASVQVNKGSQHQYCTDRFRIPTKDGFVFEYWSLEPNGKKIEPTYQYNDDTVIYAVYVGKDITLTLDANEGKFNVTNKDN